MSGLLELYNTHARHFINQTPSFSNFQTLGSEANTQREPDRTKLEKAQRLHPNA
jgi:hypothetical protein